MCNLKLPVAKRQKLTKCSLHLTRTAKDDGHDDIGVDDENFNYQDYFPKKSHPQARFNVSITSSPCH